MKFYFKTMRKIDISRAADALESIDAKCKTLYAERDEVERKLIGALREAPGRTIELPRGVTVSLKDNFVDRDGCERNTAFKTACVKRYDVVVEHAK
jgi:hypothetical protein